MTDRSINSASIGEILRRLSEGCNYYYIERPAIISRSEKDGHIFYSRFERIDSPLDEDLLKRHLNRDITIAIPLKQEADKLNFLFVYQGKDATAFISMMQYLLKKEGIDSFSFFPSPGNEGILLYIQLHKNYTKNDYNFLNQG